MTLYASGQRTLAPLCLDSATTKNHHRGLSVDTCVFAHPHALARSLCATSVRGCSSPAFPFVAVADLWWGNPCGLGHCSGSGRSIVCDRMAVCPVYIAVEPLGTLSGELGFLPLGPFAADFP